MIETELKVKGMTCQSCVRHVNRALTEIDGVTQVDVKLREGRVIVRHEEDVETGALCEAIVEAGYEAELAS